MDQETIQDEITANGNRKINIGLRCYAELKFKLAEESQNLGISLSEYCENILLNKDTLLAENQNFINEFEVLNQNMLEVMKTFEEVKLNHQTELKELKSENDNLKKAVDLLKDKVTLFTNKQLLILFQKVKGQKDLIDAPDGKKYSVTYNSPKDLLEAMIYSFNYKKP